MSLKSLKAITVSNGTYQLSGTPVTTDKNVQIFVGRREPKMMIESARILASTITGSHLTVLEGNKHGEFSMNQVDKFVEVVRAFNKK